ncbi:MAG: class I SAM-dependent methyltransferase [Cyanobacteria bacterium J06632_22]
MSSLSKLDIFNRWAPFYDSPFTTVFYQAVHTRLLDTVTLVDAANVLDLGCGTGKLLGRLAQAYPQMTGMGYDFSSEMLAQAQQQKPYPGRICYQQGQTDQLPFSAALFDAAFCTISFLHYPDPVAVLQEIRRVLKPGGEFYLADYTPSQLSGQEMLRVPIWAGDICCYSPAARAVLAEQAGLTVRRHDYLLGPILLTTFRA